MPLYEYCCSECGARFDVLRAMSDADASIACPKCNSENTHRVISLFSAIGSEGLIAGTGASCGSCTPSASCATCSLRSSR
ncbi:MAG: zinc ribbon domain-containing protein [Chloroflexi bacterium]|nr:MAG: zinc ribbon domain-containing protein [Chloroflexota bacterium]RLC85243.1 MAG: zinc ribbon domain-containing protein [Chloroflexota bacterium]HEY68013.1 zinc ribbon domain-containing protein [Thermoflexia bacterium]